MKISISVLSFLLIAACPAMAGSNAFKIQVVDKENGWPVPLVKLETTDSLAFFTDNNGVVAFDSPEYMGRQTWLSVSSDGYEMHADGFGSRGVRFTPTPGGSLKIEIERKNIARRLGRLTGAGLFAESQKVGEFLDWKETGGAGSDTVQVSAYHGKLFWIWGDTNVFNYPLGIYSTPSATTSLAPLASPKPPVAIVYDYVRNHKGEIRGTVAPAMKGGGPTWLSAVTTLLDAAKKEHLVCTYSKIQNTLSPVEFGLGEWNDQTQQWEPVYTIWKKSDAQPKPPKLFPDGHAAFWKDPHGAEWLYFGAPPRFRCPASYEAWKNPATWQEVKNPDHVESANGHEDVQVAAGQIAWSEYRKRWLLIFQQKFGRPASFGQVWYAEGKTPEGPWGPAVKVVTHRNYTFYNVQIDWQLVPPSSPFVLFEGTYTDAFADKPDKTPRYNYNQILYRLDLDDPALKPAQAD